MVLGRDTWLAAQFNDDVQFNDEVQWRDLQRDLVCVSLAQPITDFLEHHRVHPSKPPEHATSLSYIKLWNNLIIDHISRYLSPFMFP